MSLVTDIPMGRETQAIKQGEGMARCLNSDITCDGCSSPYLGVPSPHLHAIKPPMTRVFMGRTLSMPTQIRSGPF